MITKQHESLGISIPRRPRTDHRSPSPTVSLGQGHLRREPRQELTQTDRPKRNGYPSETTDGTRIAYNCGAGRIQQCDLRLFSARHPRHAPQHGHGAAWSPDGTQIVLALWPAQIQADTWAASTSWPPTELSATKSFRSTAEARPSLLAALPAHVRRPPACRRT